MNKLMPYLTGAIFGLFVLGVFVAVVSISFSGLGHVFPDNIFNQAIGLVLFDFAALTWFLVFANKCKSTMQYVWSALGFLVGLLGVLGLAGMEVGISSGWLIAAEVTRPLSYVFIGVLLSHITLIYLHHGSAPEISASISLGIEKAKIQAEGMRQAEIQLQQSAAMMGSTIRGRLVGDVLHDMNMSAVNVIDAEALPVEMPAAKPSGGGFRLPFRLPWERDAAAQPTVNDLTRSVPVETRKYPVDAKASALRCFECHDHFSRRGSLYCSDACERKAVLRDLQDLDARIAAESAGPVSVPAPAPAPIPAPAYHPPFPDGILAAPSVETQEGREDGGSAAPTAAPFRGGLAE